MAEFRMREEFRDEYHYKAAMKLLKSLGQSSYPSKNLSHRNKSSDPSKSSGEVCLLIINL